MIKVGVYGGTGRVGKLLLEDLKNEDNLELSAVYVRSSLDFAIDPSALVTNDLDVFLKACDVIID